MNLTLFEDLYELRKIVKEINSRLTLKENLENPKEAVQIISDIFESIQVLLNLINETGMVGPALRLELNGLWSDLCQLEITAKRILHKNIKHERESLESLLNKLNDKSKNTLTKIQNQ